MTNPALQKVLDEVMALADTASPHAVALGLRFVSLTPELCVAEAAYNENLIGDPETGVLHGGVATALLDHVSGMAAFAGLGAAAAPATLDLRIDYLRAAAPGRALRAEARCVRATPILAFVSAVAHDGDIDDPVALARAAFMVPKANVEQAQKARETLREQGYDV